MAETCSSELLSPGVLRVALGNPEDLTPVKLRQRPPSPFLAEMLCDAPCPFDTSAIRGRQTGRGYVVEIPLTEDEEVYGFGLQLQSHAQRGKKKTIRINSDPVADTGDSHAPAPFYVSTRGYGVLVDTARYASFWIGSAKAKREPEPSGGEAGKTAGEVRSVEELYTTRSMSMTSPVTVEIRDVDGVDVYVFWGEELREAVQRYVLFSGGGCLPPRWGLGVWYRCRTDFDQGQVLRFAEQFREERIPCDVLGLEPGWQTHSYPCSFAWSERFPDPVGLMRTLAERGYRLNLWSHLFVHPSSPVYDALHPLSGDYTAFGGLVPDLSLPEAREILAEQHARDHVDPGASGYKLDECDNSDFIWRAWSFPEITQFPSGLEGERMHGLLGILYQATIESIFRSRDRRTYCSVRSSHALAAPYPFVLYSDLYGHKEFIRGLVNAGFTGHLWSPEVRHAGSPEDL
ncbi:MAG: glycoside hydrolase, partial [Armatimonadetes bacterium]|nr:glycoside hydrolase [Armatimonadota bacterium]